MIEMMVEGIAIDQQNKTLVLLRDRDKTVYLPIWIGPAEAMSIQMELENKQPPRPMTHDLMSNILRELGVGLEHVTVNEYRDTVYYATLTLATTGGPQEVDARPSDAIALALRSKAAIYVDERVAQEAAIPMQEATPEQSPASRDEIDRFMRLIDGVDLTGSEVGRE